MESNSRCTALNVSDGKLCEDTATSTNGFFCSFHSRQCYGLYRGYKRRNAHLDRLSASPPKYLADSKTPLSNQLFSDIDSKDVCQEIHDYLFLKFQLLDRIIRARKLHTSRFFSQNMDYGHEKYVDSLQGQKAAVAKALERIERRTAEILYKNQKWFKWVRQCQDDEEAHREKEQKKVKQEAAMFRRHWKATEERMKELRAKEDKKKQDTFLDKIYKERMAEREGDGDGSDSDWDPIEDVLEDSRGNFIDLIQRFLWMAELNDAVNNTGTSGVDLDLAAAEVDAKDNTVDNQLKEQGAQVESVANSMEDMKIKHASVEEEVDLNENLESASAEPSNCSKKSKTSKGKKKGGKKATKSKPLTTDQEEPVAVTPNQTNIGGKGKKKDGSKGHGSEPEKAVIETREEVRNRLLNGTEYDPKMIGGRVVGTVDTPVIMTKTITFDSEEADKLLEDIAEIKHFLFARLLLGHAALLPAALRANSVQEFLNDEEVTASDLRDVCLKMENPGLQEIRDACADLFRSEDELDDPEESQLEQDEIEDGRDAIDEMLLKSRRKKGELPEKWIPSREKEKAEKSSKKPSGQILGPDDDGGGTAVDFGTINDGKYSQRKKIRVKICGRSIWNYPSDKVMNRGGWLHFCIIAKDSSLHEAIELCRHWDEFYELNILAIWQYFPGPKWAEWAGSRYRSQMLQLGFIMYMESTAPDAMDLCQKFQANGRNGSRKSHAVFEARNFICAHIKRDDPASRRLIQYLSMQTHQLLLLVRDAETGRLLIKPPEEERWLYRKKVGLGRASKNQWTVIKKIGPEFFDEMDKWRSWNFSFQEYYDIYVWDQESGLSFPSLYNVVQEQLMKALRCMSGVDFYKPAASVLKTLYRDEETHRVRDIRPGDDVRSIYDDFTAEGSRFVYGKIDIRSGDQDYPGRMKQVEIPRQLWYNEADMLEDLILFPEEHTGGKLNPLAVGNAETLKTWEESGYSIRKFVEGQMSGSDSDSDYDTSEFDSESETGDEDEGEDEDLSEDQEYEVSEEGDEEPADPEKVKELVDTLITNTYPEEIHELVRKVWARRDAQPSRDPMDPAVMEEDYVNFLDKEKARIFKEVWHKADTEPLAQPRYAEMKEMVKFSRRSNKSEMGTPTDVLAYRIFDWLDVFGRQDSVDVHKAIAKIAPFFLPEFFNSKHGPKYKDSLIFNQEERAKYVPTIRSHVSNTFRHTEFWKEWDDAMKAMKHTEDLDAIPQKMDIAIRPIIARLYKAGVIRNRATYYHEGQAMAGKEPDKDNYDLFIDWRPSIKTVKIGPHMDDPASVPSFKETAQNFCTKYPNARFAILKLWSAPYFYPLMIGWDNQDPTSFRDLYGRRWVWLFVPKDMPNSEWSIHLSASMRIRPFKRQFKDRVICKRDAFLVMGEDEKDLLKYASAATYAIQNKPWRWEVDIWKSWVNVDMDFLDRLDDRWLA